MDILGIKTDQPRQDEEPRRIRTFKDFQPVLSDPEINNQKIYNSIDLANGLGIEHDQAYDLHDELLTGLQNNGMSTEDFQPKALPELNFLDKVQDLWDDPAQLAPFYASGREAYRMGKLVMAASRLEQNKGMSKQDIEDLHLLREFQNKAQQEHSWGYGILDIVSQSIPFAGEIALTSGANLLARGASRAAMKGGVEMLEGLLTKEGGKLLKNKLLRVGMINGSRLVGRVAQTSLAGSARIATHYLENVMPKYGLTDDEVGEVQGYMVAPGDDAYTALKKAFVTTQIEGLSEFAGGPISKLGKNIAVRTGLYGAVKKLNPGLDFKTYQQVLKKAGYNGVFGEMLEERVADVGHWLGGQAGTEEKQEFKLPSWYQLSQELVAFAVPGVGGAAISAIKKNETVMQKVRELGGIPAGLSTKIVGPSGEEPIRLANLIKEGRKSITEDELANMHDVVTGNKTKEDMQAYLETKGIVVESAAPADIKAQAEGVVSPETSTETTIQKSRRPAHQIPFDAEKHSLRDLVEQRKGLNYNVESWTGELDYITEIGKGQFLVNKQGEGLSIDQMRMAAIEEGFLEEDATNDDFLAALEADLTAKSKFEKVWSKRRNVNNQIEEQYELMLESDEAAQDFFSKADLEKVAGEQSKEIEKLKAQVKEARKVKNQVISAKTKEKINKLKESIKSMRGAFKVNHGESAKVWAERTSKAIEHHKGKMKALMTEKIEELKFDVKFQKDMFLSEIKDKDTEIKAMKREENILHKEINRMDNALDRLAEKNEKTKEKYEKMKGELKDKIADIIFKNRADKSKEKWMGKIAKLLKSAKPVRLDGGKKKGKFTANYQRLLDPLIRVTKYSRPEGLARWTDISAMLTSDMMKPESERIKPQESFVLELEYELLRLFKGRGGTSDLESLYKSLKGLLEEGKIARELEKINWLMALQERKEHILNVVKTGLAESHPINKKQLTNVERLKQFLVTMGKYTIMSDSGLWNILDFHTHVDNKSLAKEMSVNEYEDANKLMTSQMHKVLHNTVASAYGITGDNASQIDKKIFKKMDELFTEEINLGNDLKGESGKVYVKGLWATRGEWINTYAQMQNAQVRESMKALSGNDYSEDIFARIEQVLTEKDKAFALEMIENGFGGEFAETFADTYAWNTGLNLKRVDKYVPTPRQGFQPNSSVGMGQVLSEMVVRHNLFPGYAIERVPSQLPIVRQNIIDSYLKYRSELAHYIAWSKYLRERDMILRDPEIRDAIKEQFGSNMMEQMDMTTQRFLNRGRVISETLAPLDWLRRASVFGNLAIKAKIGIGQVSAMWVYMEKVGFVSFHKSLIKFLANPKEIWKQMDAESIFVHERANYNERDLQALQKTSLFKGHSSVDRLKNRMLWPMVFGDKLSIVIGTYAMKEAGYSVAEYEEFSNDTQQSADMSQQSNFQAAGSFAKLFTMYLSAPIKYYGKELNAVKTLFMEGGTSKKNLKEVAKVIFIYHMVLPVTYQFIVNLGGTDDDDYAEYVRAAMLGSINGVPILGDLLYDLVGVLVNYTFDSDIPNFGKGEFQIPAFQVVPEIFKLISQMTEADISDEDIVKIVNQSAKVSQNLGIPAQTLGLMVKGVADLKEGEIKRGLAQIAGWSTYMVDRRFGKGGSSEDISDEINYDDIGIIRYNQADQDELDSQINYDN